jgi:hypothetical protein
MDKMEKAKCTTEWNIKESMFDMGICSDL